MNRRFRLLVAAPAAVALLAGGALVGTGSTAAAGTTGAAENYLVLYKDGASSAGAAKAVASAGGTLVAEYSQIGVVVASSTASTFATKIKSASGVQSVSATTGFATKLRQEAADGAPVADGTPVSDTDNLSGLQWDMRQIHTPEAHAITGGSRDVLVGDIDTGLDFTHPDLAANVDFANSASCVGGVADTAPAAWMDDNGHGTHTAGTIAAAANGLGIVGVAPNVRIAGIKAGNAAGYFFPEAVVCSFMWAGSHHMQVTNNSYFADPWLYNCKNDAVQRTIWTAEQRAIRYAETQGTLVVAAEGNESDDLTHPTQDVTSPDDTTPVTRAITNACAVVPVEVPGVVGVTANGNTMIKSFYSSYGISSADVVAPGGDSRLGLTAAAPNGRVLSTWPASLAAGCLRKVVDVSGALYCYQQGTSMASPHVAGIAALIASRYPGITRGALAAAVEGTADSLACPADMSVYAPYPSVSNGAPQVCTGGIGQNSFNGRGQVNALTAVGG